MGIDTSAVLIFGLPGSDIEFDEEEFESLYDFVEAKELDRASMYYDADVDDNVVGVIIASSGCYNCSEINASLFDEAIKAAAKQFKEATGQDGALYISPNV